MNVLFNWDENKRKRNLKIHELDFLDAHLVFEGLTFTFEDDRFDYAEIRYVTLGFLADTPVSIVHTENDHEIRIISFRKATKSEEEILLNQL